MHQVSDEASVVAILLGRRVLGERVILQTWQVLVYRQEPARTRFLVVKDLKQPGML